MWPPRGHPTLTPTLTHPRPHPNPNSNPRTLTRWAACGHPTQNPNPNPNPNPNLNPKPLSLSLIKSKPNPNQVGGMWLPNRLLFSGSAAAANGRCLPPGLLQSFLLQRASFDGDGALTFADILAPQRRRQRACEAGRSDHSRMRCGMPLPQAKSPHPSPVAPCNVRHVTAVT